MTVESIKTIDRKVKIWLVVVSLLTLAALTFAALTENVFAPWKMIRMKYAGMLEEKATDPRGRAIADQFEVRIVQSYVPTLEAADRCVTCHPGIDDPRMKNEPQPFRTHPGDYLAHHPAEQFGCTICHRGQGRSLVFEEAKAIGYHWDYPLLPNNLAQSSCGLCHSADEVAQAGGDMYALGKELFETKGCYSCHKLHGRGGSMGPVLDSVGLKVKQVLPMAHVEGPHTLPQWLMEHFEDPQKIVADSQMKPPQLSQEEIIALTNYMLSLQNSEIPQEFLSAGKLLELHKRLKPDPLSGQELYERFCASCHDTGEYARYDGFYRKFVPAIRGASYVQIASKDYLIENIRLGHPGTIMPAWGEAAGGLSEEEIEKLADYLLDVETPAHERLDAKMVQGAQDPSLDIRGDVTRGGLLFNKHCAACHSTGLGPDLFNSTFQAVATDGFVFTTILKGRINTPMPGFYGANGSGLQPEDITNLTAYIMNSTSTLAQSTTSTTVH